MAAAAHRDLRVALIGYGLAGSVFHAPLISTTPGLALSAIVTSNAERSAQAALDFPTARIVADSETLWRDAGDFDLVAIASPNRFHAPLAQAALAAGLHVVIDKPFATSVADGEALIAAATRAQRVLTVFQNRRWDGDFLTVRGLVERGELGRVQRFESRFERWRPSPKPGWRQNAAPEDAGGVLFDLGSHLIDQALQLFGPVRTMHVERRRRHPVALVDDDSFVALSHASGVDSHLWMSSIAADAGPRFRVLGSAAAYVKHGLDPQEDALRAGHRPGGADWGIEPEACRGEIVIGGERRALATLAGDYPAFYAGVARSLRDGTPPPVDAREALEALKAIEKALALP